MIKVPFGQAVNRLSPEQFDESSFYVLRVPMLALQTAARYPCSRFRDREAWNVVRFGA